MKHFKNILLAAVILAIALPLAGCNDETVPDPEIKKSMEDQRQAMPAGGQGGTPQAPPTSGGQ